MPRPAGRRPHTRKLPKNRKMCTPGGRRPQHLAFHPSSSAGTLLCQVPPPASVAEERPRPTAVSRIGRPNRFAPRRARVRFRLPPVATMRTLTRGRGRSRRGSEPAAPVVGLGPIPREFVKHFQVMPGLPHFARRYRGEADAELEVRRHRHHHPPFRREQRVRNHPASPMASLGVQAVPRTSQRVRPVLFIKAIQRNRCGVEVPLPDRRAGLNLPRVPRPPHDDLPGPRDPSAIRVRRSGRESSRSMRRATGQSSYFMPSRLTPRRAVPSRRRYPAFSWMRSMPSETPWDAAGTVTAPTGKSLSSPSEHIRLTDDHWLDNIEVVSLRLP